MLYGIGGFITDWSIRPDALARMVEERGFESLWVAEHTHIPASRLSPAPGGNPLGEQYWHGMDPFVALAAAAVATTRLKLGTGICLLVERDPIVTAKEVASLDLLSNGRFLFGIGGGWNAEEMADHGTDFKRRWRILRERVLAMKQIWTQDEAAFQGQYVHFDKMWAFPKPVQKPHPPIIMGGDGPTTLDRVLEYCDGWIPGAGVYPPQGGEDLPQKIATLRRRAKEAGRDPDSIEVTIQGMPLDRDLIDRYEQAGAKRVTFGLGYQRGQSMEQVLDRFTSIIK